MAEDLSLRPQKVKLFESITRYFLWLLYPYLIYHFLYAQEFLRIPGSDKYLVGFILLIVTLFIHGIGLWITYLATRRKSKVTYVVMVILYAISIMQSIHEASSTIEEFGILISIGSFLLIVWQFYLLISKEFRGWIYSHSESELSSSPH